MLLEINMNKVDYNSDYEHEDCLNELLELNNSFEIYYIEDNDIVYIDNGSQLLNAYDYISDVFYLETDNFNINYLDKLSKCIEII